MEGEPPKKRSSGRHPRKKPKFRGNIYVDAKNVPRKGTPSPAPGPSSSPEKPGPSSSTFRKLTLKKRLPDEDCESQWSGYRLFDLDIMFRHLEENCRCAKCNGPLKFSEENQGGLACKIIQTCTNCKFVCSWENSEKIGEKKNLAEINRRSVMAVRSLGQGYRSLKKFCSHMELPEPVKESSFYQILGTIHSSAESLAVQSMKDAAEKEANLTGGNDVAASGDGTWQRRGHNSLNGVCTLIGVKSGKVLDVEVLSKACTACAQYDGDRESDEFEEWYLAHVPFCQQNHLGSSSKMESDGLVNIFKRSEEERGLRYIQYIGDGDSATFKCLREANPYPGITIEKKECVGHIQKRMGRQLRNLKSKMKGHKLSDGKGLSGRHRLTDEVIDRIQVYYGNAIRANSTVPDMQKGIWAIFFHMQSTDEKHDHSYCPTGEESWCKFQQAVARGEEDDFKHGTPMLDPVCMEACRPVFEELSKEDLLQRCVGAFTQNANESFHNLIWMYGRKDKFCGRRLIELAVSFAILDFNDGQSAKIDLFQSVGLKVGPKLMKWTNEQDTTRVQMAEKQMSIRTKDARQAKRRKLAVQEERQREEEGLYYEAGAF